MSIEVKIFILLCLSTMGIGIMSYYSKEEKISPWSVYLGGAFGGIVVGGFIVLCAGLIASKNPFEGPSPDAVMVWSAVILALMPLLVLVVGRNAGKHSDPQSKHGNKCDCWSCQSQLEDPPR